MYIIRFVYTYQKESKQKKPNAAFFVSSLSKIKKMLI